MERGVTTFIEVVLNQELGEPFRRDAMKKPVVVAGIDASDMRPQQLVVSDARPAPPSPPGPGHVHRNCAKRPDRRPSAPLWTSFGEGCLMERRRLHRQWGTGR